MERFTNILFVPLAKRGNPSSARRVVDLCLRNRARLTVLGVVAEPSRWQRLFDHPVSSEAVRTAEQEAMLNRLKTVCGDQDELDTRFLVRAGSAPKVVIDEVQGSGHDLVVVTADDDREDHAAVKRLLRACPCPVWVIRPTRARIQRVLAAVDPDPGERDLNNQILDLARSMHELHGGELHVVHVWQLIGEATLRNSAFAQLGSAEVDKLLLDEQEHHRRALDDLLECQPSGTTWQVHLVKGRPGDAIADLVTRKRINLLVMGTVGRAGVSGLLVGNTAERLLDEVGCSVLATKPSNFTSPLAPAAHEPVTEAN